MPCPACSLGLRRAQAGGQAGRSAARHLASAAEGEAGRQRGAGAARGSDQAGQERGAGSGSGNPDARHQAALHEAEARARDAAPARDERAGGRAAPEAPQGKPGAACAIAPSAVFLMTLLMASASGLGALPYFFVGTLSKEWGALANALACGVMLAASFDLVHEGEPYGAALVLLGVVLGARRGRPARSPACL